MGILRAGKFVFVRYGARRWRSAIRAVLAIGVASAGCAAASGGAQVSPGSDALWQVPSERPRGPDIRGESAVVRLNKAALDAVLRGAGQGTGASAGVVVALPMPDGTFARFRVVESSMISPELAAAFPEIRTYSGQGLDDPTATTRFGWTANGFHAIVIGSSGSVSIDPYRPGDLEYYISFRKTP